VGVAVGLLGRCGCGREKGGGIEVAMAVFVRDRDWVVKEGF